MAPDFWQTDLPPATTITGRVHSHGPPRHTWSKQTSGLAEVISWICVCSPERGYMPVACSGLNTWEELSCIHRNEVDPGPMLPEHSVDFPNINPTFISCTDYWDLCQPTLCWARAHFSWHILHHKAHWWYTQMGIWTIQLRILMIKRLPLPEVGMHFTKPVGPKNTDWSYTANQQFENQHLHMPVDVL